MNSENLPNPVTAGAKTIRLLRPSLVVLCGPAACGKSTFARRHFQPTRVISSDWARALVCDDERDQRFNAQAFALVHFLAEQRLTLNRLCVVDSTAITTQARKDLLDLAKRCQVPTTLILFDVPLEACVERDEKRERSVGRAVVDRQYQAFEQSKATIHQEGFGEVVVIRDNDLENVRIEILFRPVARSPQRPQRPDGNGPRRSERLPSQPSESRTGKPGGNGQSVPPLPGAKPTVVSSAKGVTVQTQVPGPLGAGQPSSTRTPPGSPSAADKPSASKPAAAVSGTASHAVPRPVPAEVK